MSVNLTHALLGQSDSAARAGNLFQSVLPWLAVMAAVVIVGGLILALLRRTIRQDSTPPESFTLDGLRKLHAEGKLSDEEYEKARMIMISRVRQSRSDNAPKTSEHSPSHSGPATPDSASDG